MQKRQSRLSKRIERKSRTNLILSLLGIVAVFFLVVKLGIPLLVNFSLSIANQKDKAAQSAQNSNTSNAFIAPPTLNPPPTATNSAKIVLTGTGNPKQTVRIYVNGQLQNEITTKDNGSFSATVDIIKGQNTITAKSELNGKESNFSDPATINYIDSKPTLDVTSPSDGQSFSKDQNSAPVSGKTSSGARVTVNGFWAIVDDNNNFSYSLPLQSGDNQIKIIATDQAGNATEKDLKVIYSN